MGIDLTGATPFWRAAFAQDLEAMKLLAAHGADPKIPTMWPEVGMRASAGGRAAAGGLGAALHPGGDAERVSDPRGGGRRLPRARRFQRAQRPGPVPHRREIPRRGAGSRREPRRLLGLHAAPLRGVRGDNALIEYLVSKGADVKAITRLGQSPADMARGGRGGFFTRASYPETVELLTSLGSTLDCLDTHFLDTGDFCKGAGVNKDSLGDSAVETRGEEMKRIFLALALHIAIVGCVGQNQAAAPAPDKDVAVVKGGDGAIGPAPTTSSKVGGSRRRTTTTSGPGDRSPESPSTIPIALSS